jgi:spoIIIJ-associated protein
MAQVVEVSGVDVEAAVARALRQLGLNRDQVEIEVVREGKRGFLGFGSEESIVRVTAKSSAAPAAGRSGGGRGRRGGRGPRSGQAPASTSARGSEEERQRMEGVARAAAEARDDDDDEDDDLPLRTPAASGSRGGYSSRAPISRGGADGGRGGRGPRDGGRGGRGGGGRGGRGFDRGRPRGGAITLPVRIPGAPDEGPVAPIADVDDEIDLAGRTLRDVLTLLGLTETDIAAREPETPGDGVGLMAQVFDITGLDEDTSDELGALIGRRGETLQSLQYLLNVIVSSRYDGEQIFAVDIEQYRRRREQALVDLARRVAQEVRDTGDVITLEPMSPAERRIVHLTLQEEDGVATASVGEGADRQVEVMPA